MTLQDLNTRWGPAFSSKPLRYGTYAVTFLMIASTTSASGPESEDPTQTGAGVPIEAADPVDELDEFDNLDLGGTVDLLFEDFDIVISASRSEQSANLAPVPVSTISSDDIHYSGVGELPELFDFVPGVDALRLDKNRWALGVRGLHQTFSDRTLFLVNGRNASNPIYGGVDFPTLPIFLEDIDRVEIVRGPGGAAWGANAFNGVVNVIEKDLRDTTGVHLTTRITEHGDFRSFARIGAADDRFAWRISAEYNDIEPSNSDNLILSTTTSAPAISEDFRRNSRMRFAGEYTIDDETTIDFSLGASHVERADSPFLAVQIDQDDRVDLLTGHLKYEQNRADGSSGYIQWYGTYIESDRPSLWAYDAFDQSIDAQYSFDRGDDHTVTLGGTARFITLDISQVRTTDALPSGTSDEQWIGFFVGDHWEIDDRWTLESQIRVDWYSETQVDWAGRAALLRALDTEKNHVVRVALAKAFRTPQTGLRELDSERFPLGGGLFGVNFVPSGDIDNEELYSMELGYTGKLSDGLTLRADAYLQYYQDLTGAITLPEPAPSVGRLFFTIDNIGAARAWGFESELKYQRERFSASVWYAYNDFEFDLTNQNARAFLPAKHKLGSTLRYMPNDWLALNVNYRYTNTTPETFVSEIEQYHRLDLNAAFAIDELHAEIQIGVTDLLDQTALRIFDQSATSFAAEVPGRTAFVQLHMDF